MKNIIISMVTSVPIIILLRLLSDTWICGYISAIVYVIVISLVNRQI